MYIQNILGHIAYRHRRMPDNFKGVPLKLSILRKEKWFVQNIIWFILHIRPLFYIICNAQFCPCDHSWWYQSDFTTSYFPDKYEIYQLEENSRSRQTTAGNWMSPNKENKRLHDDLFYFSFQNISKLISPGTDTLNNWKDTICQDRTLQSTRKNIARIIY